MFDKLSKGIYMDRDGVINELIEGGKSDDPASYIHTWDQFQFSEGVMDALEIAYTEMPYELLVVSNQSGISRYPDKVTYKGIMDIFKRMFLEIDREIRTRILSNQSIPGYPQVALPDDTGDKDPTLEEQHVLSDVIFCPHHPDAGCSCRKPKPGMIYYLAFKWSINLAKSWMIGDSDSDIKAGWNAGIRKLIKIDPARTPFEPDQVNRWSYKFNSSEGIPMMNLLDAIKFIRWFDTLPKGAGVLNPPMKRN